MIHFADTQVGMPLVHLPSKELCYLQSYEGISRWGKPMYTATGAEGEILDAHDAFTAEKGYIRTIQARGII